jgi:hypothetical protein
LGRWNESFPLFEEGLESTQGPRDPRLLPVDKDLVIATKHSGRLRNESENRRGEGGERETGGEM